MYLHVCIVCACVYVEVVVFVCESRPIYVNSYTYIYI